MTAWEKLNGDKGEPPVQVNMAVNGYWNTTGYCTCYEPNSLPTGLITAFQIVALIWEIDTQLWFTLPWTLLIWGWNLVDFILDWIFIGIFIWFKPIAFVFIWIINVAQLPINIFGWMNELMWGLHKLPVEFWMWFWGDGCFLRWGKNCWTDFRIPFRTNQTYMDMSFFNKGADVTINEPETPEFTNTSSWGFDFESRLGWGNIMASIEEWKDEEKLKKLIEERKA